MKHWYRRWMEARAIAAIRRQQGLSMARWLNGEEIPAREWQEYRDQLARLGVVDNPDRVQDQ